MPFFWPGIREEYVEGVNGFFGEETKQEVLTSRSNESHIFETAAGSTVAAQAVILRGAFHRKEVTIGSRRCKLVEKFAFAGSDFYVGWALMGEKFGPGKWDSNLVEVDVDHSSSRPR
jgi:hypothetical protein